LETRTSNKCTEINGCVDNTTIVNRFAEHFSSSYCCNSSIQADRLRQEYLQLRGGYHDRPIVDDNDIFDTDLPNHLEYETGKGTGYRRVIS